MNDELETMRKQAVADALHVLHGALHLLEKAYGDYIQAMHEQVDMMQAAFGGHAARDDGEGEQ